MALSPASMLDLLLVALACFAAGAVGAVATASSFKLSRWVGHGGAFLGAAAALALAFAGFGGATLDLTVPALFPLGGVRLGIDRSSAFFVAVVAAGAIPCALYAVGYTRHDAGKHSPAAMGLAFNVFVAAMVLIPLARNALTFLVLWEIMSLASYFLVLTDHEREPTVAAGWVYFVMAHAGFAALLIGFLLLTRAAGTMDFAAWSSGAAHLTPASRNLIFVLLALGFGSKAGVVPVHVWLPRAHPAAPSHVSALMSGVMIKLGIYGLLRAGFDWLGTGPLWWGGMMIVLGAASGVVGALYALVDVDLKRVLAYSSIENIGIILLGLGAGMLFQTSQWPGFAALALAAALSHTFNHALFKTLLFMGAGAVLNATQTRNMEELGGLIKRMPQTALFFLIGSLAIAALPPFNGFVSEWLTFQSLLLSFQIPARSVNLTFALGIAALALTSGLAAACFVRAFGITFLALPRSEAAARAREGDWTMRAAMALLAFACLILGLVPAIILEPVNAAVFELTSGHAALQFDLNGLTAGGGFGRVAPLWIGFSAAVLLFAIALAVSWVSARGCRYYETWGCGRALQSARFEYTAAAFANPFTRVFALLYRPNAALEVSGEPPSRYFVRKMVYRHEGRLIFEEALYRPLLRTIQAVAGKARVLQSGNVHGYLMYILIALVALLLLAV